MENSKEIQEQETTSTISFNFCPNCGKECDKSLKFCGNCGNVLYFDYNKEQKRKVDTKNITFSQFFERISPTKQRLLNTKIFMNNNVELTVLLGVIILLMSLVSIKWGILLFCITLIIYYLWGALKYTKETPLNLKIKILYKSGLKHIKEKRDTITLNSQSTSNNAQESLHIAKEPQVKIDEETIDSKLVKSQNKPVRLGITGLLLIISSGISLYGLLGAGFFSFSEANLSQLFSSSSKYLSNFEQMGEFFTGSSEDNSTILFIIGKALIVLPILVILFAFISSIFGHLLAFLFAVVELVLLFLIVDTIGEFASIMLGQYSDDFFTLVLEYGDEVVGLPAFALIIGTIGMVIFSILKVLSNLSRY